ncbi:MAG: DUF3667 domain-containing protein [Crocinitomicaceae bacterium]
MEENTTLLKTPCLNCGASAKGNFCHECGQSMRDNSDRSISRLLGDFLSNVFFLDNRFFLSVWYLIRFPGRMTIEFLDGKRKRFISPVGLFLFINVIYFFVSPLSDYSLSLEDQFYSQPYSSWIKELIVDKIETEGLESKAYGIIYQNASDNISKSVMILNIPLIAFFVYLMTFKRRRFYYDSLIFAFHFFSLFLASLVILDWVGKLFDFLPESVSIIFDNNSYFLFAFALPLLFAMISIKKFIVIRWHLAILASLGVFISVFLTNLIYRFIIFFLAFWVT